MAYDQETLRRFISRRHPEYNSSVAHWTFLEATYEGGRDWFAENIFRYIKEGEKEFKDRVARAYRFNHTRETVDLVQKYIFKSKVARNVDDAPKEITDFWEEVDFAGLDINQYMRLLSTMTSIFGIMWVFVDSNKSAEAITAADERETGARVYTYMVKPIDVLDIGFSKDGELNWILVREYVRDDADPITSSGKVFEQYRLWTRYDWSLFTEEEGEGGDKIVSLIDHGEHGLGIVPCFPVTHVIGNHRYKAPSLIDDTAYLDRAVANYLSNLDAIIQDQTFSQLVMPAQGLLPGDEKYDQLLEMGTKRIFTYDGEAGAEPKYISPDAGQARLIVEVVNKIIAEIYHTIGMAGERTKQDNAVGIDNSSGVAKAYDFERVNSLLASKAASLENAENRLVNLVLKWHGKSEPEQELVKYPQTFDVRSLYDEFTIAERLALIEAPAEVRREQMVQVIDKLFPAMSRALIDKMKAELKDWGETPEPEAPPTKFGEARKNAQTENRQGQVTADTKTSQ